MGTMNNPGTTQQSGQTGQQQVVGSPITNEAYNIVSALHSKLEGLEAYRKYAKDGDAQIWQTLTQSEIQSVSVLIDQLERMVKDGRFRMQASGTRSG